MRLFTLINPIMPAIVTILLIIVGGVNFQINGFFAIMPLFAASSVFYWRLYNPKYMRKLFVFILGIFQDMIYGNLLGISSLSLLILLFGIKTQRENIYHQPFWACWIIFAIMMGLFILINWLLNCLINWQLLFDISLIYQFIITVLIYPILHRLFSFLGDGNAT